MVKFRKVKRYSSLISDEGRVLHIHHTGPSAGEIHLDKPFWQKMVNIEDFCGLLSKSYKVRNLKCDIRVEKVKKI